MLLPDCVQLFIVEVLICILFEHTCSANCKPPHLWIKRTEFFAVCCNSSQTKHSAAYTQKSSIENFKGSQGIRKRHHWLAILRILNMALEYRGRKKADQPPFSSTLGLSCSLYLSAFGYYGKKQPSPRQLPEHRIRGQRTHSLKPWISGIFIHLHHYPVSVSPVG